METFIPNLIMAEVSNLKIGRNFLLRKNLRFSH
jgi:hypothetical protein